MRLGKTLYVLPSTITQQKGGQEKVCQMSSLKKSESLDSALRRFKRNCAKAGIQQEIRKREHYEKAQA